MRNRGVITLTSELLKEKLGLQKHHSINGITHNPFNGTVDILLSGVGLPPVKEGAQSPHLDYYEITSKDCFCTIDGDKYEVMHDNMDFLQAIELMRKGKYILRPCDDKVYHISPRTNEFHVVATYIVPTDVEPKAFFHSDDVIANDWIVLENVSKRDTNTSIKEGTSYANHQ